MTKDEDVVAKVRHWVERVVIGLNLCPFAEREHHNGRINYVLSQARSEEGLLSDLQVELINLLDDPSIETTILIHPYVLESFADYNQFLALSEELLQLMNLSSTFQIASFHPNYQFAEYGPDDVENYTNRSPYPLLHILREASLDEAIDHHPNIHEVPFKNKELMKRLGVQKLRALLDKR